MEAVRTRIINPHAEEAVRPSRARSGRDAKHAPNRVHGDGVTKHPLTPAFAGAGSVLSPSKQGKRDPVETHSELFPLPLQGERLGEGDYRYQPIRSFSVLDGRIAAARFAGSGR